MDKYFTIFILGTTAVGKTKLSLILANLLASQIISSDSMQLYKHANIMTAKPTHQQLDQVKHNMIDLLELNELGYNRNKYFNISSSLINKLHIENKIPIIIGGTNYYIQTLLFKVNNQSNQSNDISEQRKNQADEQMDKLTILTLQEKYQMLKSIDPDIAAKIHKNDKHRLDGYLRKYYETKKKPSQTYIPYTHQLRNPNTILFWIRNSNKQQLKRQMKSRINKMINKDGIVEILSIYHYLKENSNNQGGVLQSIGYKQFKKFIESIKISIPSNLKTYEQIYSWIYQSYDTFNINLYQQQLEACKQLLLNSTYQYSKRQITWIKNRIFSSHINKNNFFLLELSGKGQLMDRFNTQVKQKAIQVVNSIRQKGFGSITGGISQDQLEEVMNVTGDKDLGKWKKYYCQLCKKQASGSLQLKQHNESKMHKLNQKKKKKQKEKLQISIKKLNENQQND